VKGNESYEELVDGARDHDELWYNKQYRILYRLWLDFICDIAFA